MFETSVNLKFKCVRNIICGIKVIKHFSDDDLMA